MSTLDTHANRYDDLAVCLPVHCLIGDALEILWLTAVIVSLTLVVIALTALLVAR